MKIICVLFFSLIFSVVCFSKTLSVAERLERDALSKLEVKQSRSIALFGWGKKDKPTDDSSAEDDGSTDEAQGATPESLEDGEISPAPIEIIPQGPLTATLPWQKPNYSNQAGALGYSEGVFSVPPGLKTRVAFWKDIYSKYTTNQGVMHDSHFINIVYQVVDFNSIMRDNSLNPRQKHHAREHLVKTLRHEIEDRLKRLSKLKSPDGLTGEDLRVWKMFESVSEPNKFIAATKKGRIRFQLGQKDRFALGIYYSGRYLREMEKIFRAEGLPIELTRLPFVESSFNIYARSRVGASGIWQFMRRTARPYMIVNHSVDERNDPIKATRSSARLLRSNFMMLKSWPLALTGYNHGPNGIARIVKKTHTTDLTQIIDVYSSRRFGFASENFYACFLAALEVEKNADKYFPGAKWSVPLEHAEIRLSKPIPFEAIKVWFKNDDDLAQLFNPHISTRVRIGRTSVPKNVFIRIPVAMKNLAEDYLNGKIKLKDMEAEAKQIYSKIKILPEGTPVATISAAPSPTVTPSQSPVPIVSSTPKPMPTPAPTPFPSPTIVQVPSPTASPSPIDQSSPEATAVGSPIPSPTVSPSETPKEQLPTPTSTPYPVKSPSHDDDFT